MMKKGNRILAILLSLLITIFVCGSASAASIPFTDVPVTSWYYEPVVFVYNAGLMNGTSQTLFSPNTNTTRAAFTTIIGRLEEELSGPLGSNWTHPFTDVSSTSYYSQYVGWAYQKGIINGTSATKFSPNSTVTRQETAAIINRYMNTCHGGIRELTSITFSDESSIAKWALEDVRICGNGKIFLGEPGAAFNPNNSLKRCEIAAVVSNIINYQIN